MDLGSLEKNPGLTDYYDVLRSDEWLYRKSPDFSHCLVNRFDWGGIEIHLDVIHANITGVEIFTDCLYPEMIENLKAALKDQAYNRESVALVCEAMVEKQPDWKNSLKDIENLLLSEIIG